MPCITVAALRTLFMSDSFKHGWATGVWLPGQSTAVLCAVMSSRRLTCWASNSCLMTDDNDKPQGSGRDGLWIHQVLLLISFKNLPSYLQPSTSALCYDEVYIVQWCTLNGHLRHTALTQIPPKTLRSQCKCSVGQGHKTNLHDWEKCKCKM